MVHGIHILSRLLVLYVVQHDTQRFLNTFRNARNILCLIHVVYMYHEEHGTQSQKHFYSILGASLLYARYRRRQPLQLPKVIHKPS